MKLHERVKYIREQKRISQESVAHELGMSQSQYSRRESGEVNFLAEEIGILSKALDTKVSEIYGEQPNIFNNHNQKGGNFGYHITIPEKLIEQYELRLKEKDELIKLLKDRLG
ncbi:MAG: helix-turn-helix transcriptional regulator [Flavobacteriia bacterium]|nr:helix-turn-helix transcriptional regulator [Flavobacteriia bacterium]OJX37696.1 MAG: hypothetical protein BGO87_11575 [Flavobacteriia bacterium 40-80]